MIKNIQVELYDIKNDVTYLFENMDDCKQYMEMEEASKNLDPIGGNINANWKSIKFKRITKGSVNN